MVWCGVYRHIVNMTASVLLCGTTLISAEFSLNIEWEARHVEVTRRGRSLYVTNVLRDELSLLFTYVLAKRLSWEIIKENRENEFWTRFVNRFPLFVNYKFHKSLSIKTFVMNYT